MGLINCLKEREEAIKELTILKLKKLYSNLSEEEYLRNLMDINKNLSDYDKKLAKVAFDIISIKIEEAKEKEDIKILFKDEVMVNYKETFIPKVCNLLLVGTEVLEVIEIVPLNPYQIYVNKETDMKLVALAVIDKYLTSISCDYIRISVVQPNLTTSFYFETAVADLIHECEYDLMYL